MDDERPRANILMAEGYSKDGKLRQSPIAREHPVCSRCGVETTSHVDHTGRIWCHKCFTKYGIGEIERRWKEERERMGQMREEIRQLAEASFVQAVVVVAKKVTAEEVQEAVHEVGGEPALCAKCGGRSGVVPVELGPDNPPGEDWWAPGCVSWPGTLYLCEECAREVFPKEYDEEEARPDDGQLPVPGEPPVCATHGVEDHDCEEG